ncbi:MAG: hypothetical protein EOO14_00375 [Chitinophagaceae bacterium]|nr:MAG: hypothetical protein EOO14_00375 [Chitinophagaceae bacterium]
MPLHNTYAPLQSLASVAPKTGGLCGITFFKREDVLTWPETDPVTGVLKTAVALKAGRLFYTLQAMEKDRVFSEVMKTGQEGDYFDIQVTGKIGGSNAGLILSLDQMKFHQWGLIVKERTGDQRLVGNADSCAKLTWDYTSGDNESSRLFNLKFSWQHANCAPVYTATAFSIVLGSSTYSVGSLILVQRFKVGEPGAPMADYGTTFTHASLVGKRVLVIVDGMALPCDDGSAQIIDWGLQRHIQKLISSNTITFVGGVVQNEVIEIYEFF